MINGRNKMGGVGETEITDDLGLDQFHIQLVQANINAASIANVAIYCSGTLCSGNAIWISSGLSFIGEPWQLFVASGRASPRSDVATGRRNSQLDRFM